MRKFTKAAASIFLASLSVYPGGAFGAGPAKSAGDAGDPASTKGTAVKLIEDRTDPFASTPSTAPATNPAVADLQPAMTGNVDGTFSLSITNGADLVETLRVIGYQAQKSILPSKDVKSTLPALDLYNVTVHEALDAILRVNGFVYREQGNFIYIYSAKEAAELDKAARVQTTEVFRVFYTPATNAANMIKPVLSADAQVSLTTAAISGLDSGTKDIGGNSHATEDMIVVTDYAENIERARKLLKEIDRRPQQILIEATIMRAALSDNNALGVDFNILSGVDFTSLSASGGQITGANTDTGKIANSGAKSSVGTGNAFSSAVGNGLKVGFLNSDVSIFVNALEGVTNTTVLANPKVLALNKQKGEVIVGRKDGYLTTTVTESSTVQTVDFLDTGTRLIFRPYIGDDGYVRMEIHPEDSSGGLNAANLPFKVTTEVTSNIMVKDGHTVVIGGLFREASTSAKNQIPVLGNIPLAGALFRNQSDQTQREEIIILLTPHVVKDDSAYSDASQEMLKQAEQLRIGVRKGMMFWGAERLAEGSYEAAVTEMSKPNPNRRLALWHLDCATNLNSTFIEAINMKRQLTGETLTESDNSSIRGFVRRQIMAEQRNVSRIPATAPIVLEPATQPARPPAVDIVKVDLPPTQQVAVEVHEMAKLSPTTMPSAVPFTSPTTKVASWSADDACFTIDAKLIGLDEAVAVAPTTQPINIVDIEPLLGDVFLR